MVDGFIVSLNGRMDVCLRLVRNVSRREMEVYIQNFWWGFFVVIFCCVTWWMSLSFCLASRDFKARYWIIYSIECWTFSNISFHVCFGCHFFMSRRCSALCFFLTIFNVPFPCLFHTVFFFEDLFSLLVLKYALKQMTASLIHRLKDAFKIYDSFLNFATVFLLRPLKYIFLKEYFEITLNYMFSLFTQKCFQFSKVSAVWENLLLIIKLKLYITIY